MCERARELLQLLFSLSIFIPFSSDMRRMLYVRMSVCAERTAGTVILLLIWYYRAYGVYNVRYACGDTHTIGIWERETYTRTHNAAVYNMMTKHNNNHNNNITINPPRDYSLYALSLYSHTLTHTHTHTHKTKKKWKVTFCFLAERESAR